MVAKDDLDFLDSTTKFLDPTYSVQVSESEKNFGPGEMSQQYSMFWIWAAISDTIGLVKQGLCDKIGVESRINVWMDPWIPTVDGFRILDEFKVQGGQDAIGKLLETVSKVWTTYFHFIVQEKS